MLLGSRLSAVGVAPPPRFPQTSQRKGRKSEKFHKGCRGQRGGFGESVAKRFEADMGELRAQGTLLPRCHDVSLEGCGRIVGDVGHGWV